MDQQSPDVNDERLRRDIERARGEVAGRLRELKERVRPSRLAHDAADAALHSVSSRVKNARGAAASSLLRAAGQGLRMARQAPSLGVIGVRHSAQHPLAGALLMVASSWMMGRLRRGRGMGNSALGGTLLALAGLAALTLVKQPRTSSARTSRRPAESALDETIEASFPASDPPSSIPDPAAAR